MSATDRQTVIHEDNRLLVVRRKRNGSKQPPHVTIKTKHPSTGELDQGLRLSLDELFDLTEVLDDLCDTIEDETYGRRNPNA